jgi:hypothetical protein
MDSDLQKQLDYLINNLHAYDDLDHRGKGLRNAVKTKLNWWAKATGNREEVRVPVLQEDLWRQARARVQQLPYQDRDWHQLQLFPASSKHLQVTDKRGRILAYRLPLPEEHLQRLISSEHLIPTRHVKKHSRGLTSNRHWGLWKKYVVEPRMSADYLKDLPYSQQWLDENQGLFQQLSHILRLLDPKMYVRFTSIKRFLPEGLKPTCGAWYACAVNLGMTEDGTRHQDRSDYYCGLNVSVGWGEYQSSKLALWDLGLVMEALPGNAIFFLGRLITHNTVDIVGGTRNYLNCFVHQAPLSWKDQRHRERTGYDRTGKRQKTEKKRQRAETTSRDSETALRDCKKPKQQSQSDPSKQPSKQEGRPMGMQENGYQESRPTDAEHAETTSRDRVELPPRVEQQQQQGSIEVGQQGDKKGKGKQEGKQKDRQQDDAENAESATTRDPDTDEELEAMYELRLGEAAEAEEAEEEDGED